jgi:hypothetical protein
VGLASRRGTFIRRSASLGILRLGILRYPELLFAPVVQPEVCLAFTLLCLLSSRGETSHVNEEVWIAVRR